MNKKYLVLIIALMTLAAIIITGCNLKLKPGIRACTSDRVGFYRCGNHMDTIEQCTANDAGQLVWDYTLNCSELDPADHYTCDYNTIFGATDIGSDPVRDYCAPGCIYRHPEAGSFGFLVGEHGCANDTTYGECSSAGQITWVDCTSTGGGCYNNTCFTADELQAVAFKMELWYGQEMNEALSSNQLTNNDLPYVLSRGMFEETIGKTNNSVGYSQTIHFTDGTGRFVFANDDDGDKLARDYLFFDDTSSAYAFNYTLLFDEPGVMYDPWTASEDIEGSTLHMLGKDMTITLFNISGQGTVGFTDEDGNEYVLEGGKEAVVNGVEIDGTFVHPWGDWGAGKGISISYVPVDKEYISVGESLVDPIFNAFEIELASIKRVPGDTISLETKQFDGDLTFNNNDGVEVDVPFYLDNDSRKTIIGNDYHEDSCEGMVLLEGDTCDSLGSGAESIEGVMFFFIDAEQRAHVIEVTSLDPAGTIDLTDLTYSKNYADKPVSINGGTSVVDLGDLGNAVLTIDIDEGSITAVDLGQAPAYEVLLSSGARLKRSEEDGTLQIIEEDIPTIGLLMEVALTGAFERDLGISPPILLPSPDWGEHWNVTDLSASKSDKDTKYYVTNWGTQMIYNSGTKDGLKILYPDEPVVATVVVKSTLADVITSPPPATSSNPSGGSSGDEETRRSGGGSSGGGAMFLAEQVFSNLEDESLQELSQEEQTLEQTGEATPSEQQHEIPGAEAPEGQGMSGMDYAVIVILALVLVAAGVMFVKRRKKQ